MRRPFRVFVRGAARGAGQAWPDLPPRVTRLTRRLLPAKAIRRDTQREPKSLDIDHLLSIGWTRHQCGSRCGRWQPRTQPRARVRFRMRAPPHHPAARRHCSPPGSRRRWHCGCCARGCAGSRILVEPVLRDEGEAAPRAGLGDREADIADDQRAADPFRLRKPSFHLRHVDQDVRTEPAGIGDAARMQRLQPRQRGGGEQMDGRSVVSAERRTAPRRPPARPRRTDAARRESRDGRRDLHPPPRSAQAASHRREPRWRAGRRRARRTSTTVLHGFMLGSAGSRSSSRTTPYCRSPGMPVRPSSACSIRLPVRELTG